MLSFERIQRPITRDQSSRLPAWAERPLFRYVRIGQDGTSIDQQYYEVGAPKIMAALALVLSSGDEFAFGAMDGQNFTSPSMKSTLPQSRQDPTVNFYVIYGLAFETLVRVLGDGSRTAFAIVSLRLIGSLAHPRLCGSVLTGAFFDELCTVCYRIALSEPAIVKAEMTRVMRELATTRNPSADGTQIRRALAVITYTLRQVVPSPDVNSGFLPTDSAQDRVDCLKTAFDAYSRVIDVCDMSQRADLCAGGLHLCGDILKDEGPTDLAGGLLGSMKMLLDKCLASQVPGITAEGDRVVHGLLSACLTNIDEMR